LRQAEQARLGVAGLGQRGDGADFDKAETEGRQTVYAVAIFVEAGGEADRIGKGQSHHGARIVRDAIGDDAAQAKWIRVTQAAQREIMGSFRVDLEQRGAE